MGKKKKSDITQSVTAEQSPLIKQPDRTTLVRSVGLRNNSCYNPRTFLFACLACTLAVYLYSTLHNQFTNWDDQEYITNNAIIQSWNSGIFTKVVMGNWAPVHMLVLALQYHLFGLHPAGYHLLSLLLHLCNVALVFLVVLKLSGKLPVAAIVALFFGIHPMHVESVAWVSAQKDLLYTGFYLAAMLVYCNYKESQGSGFVKNKYLMLTIIFFILSCLSKGMGVTLPVVLVLIDSYRADNWNWKFIAGNIRTKIIFFVIAIGFGIAAYLAQTKGGALYNSLDNTSGEQAMFACYGLVVYVAKFIVPVSLSAFYPYPLKDSTGTYPFIFYLSPLIVVLLIAFFAGLITWRKKQGKSGKVLLFGLLFFIANIVLVLQLKSVGFAILAERYAYLSYFGLLFIAAETFYSFWEKYSIRAGKMMVAGFCLIVVAFGITSFRYTESWKDGGTLWNHVIDKYAKARMKYFHIVYYNRGVTYMIQGKPDSAIVDFNQAIALNPEYLEAYHARGLAYVKRKKSGAAITDFTIAIRLNPDYAEAYTDRGATYASMGKPGLAITDYTQAITLNPKDTAAYNGRGVTYATQGKPDLAIADYTSAINLNPHYAEAYNNRGLACKTQEKTDMAISDYTNAISLNPHYAEAYYDRGIAYEDQGKTELAIADFNKAIIEKPRYSEAWNNRGAVYASQGKPDRAIDDFNTAININPHYTKAYINRGSAYVSEGKTDLAIADFNQAMSFDSTNAEPCFNRGLVYARQGKQAQAIDDFTKAINLNPEYAGAYSNRGVAYMNQGKTEMAINDFTEAINLNPKYAEAYSNRGVAYVKQGKPDLGIADYTAAINLNPHYVEALNNRGFAYAHQGKLDLAIADCTRAISLNPTYINAYVYRGIAEKEKGDDAQAQIDFQKARSLASMHKE